MLRRARRAPPARATASLTPPPLSARASPRPRRPKEANTLQADFYRCALPAQTRDWLAKFSLAGDGRFFVAQLHAWNASMEPENVYFYGAVASIRDAQARGVAAAGVGVELASAVDGGDPYAPATSIHPRGKQTPGRRLAAAILARRFNVAVPFASPRYARAAAAPPPAGATLALAVALEGARGAPPPLLTYVAPSPASNSSRCPTDLTIPAFMCAGFELMLDDAPFPNGTWVPAAAAIDAARTGLVLSAAAPAGARAAGSRNGWNAWPIVNFYAEDGLLPLLPWSEAV